MAMKRVQFLAWALILLNATACSHIQHVQAGERKQGGRQVYKRSRAPRDYAYSPLGSRVKDLIGFFEVLDRSSVDKELAKKQNSVLSLAESTSKLHRLTDGLPLEVKCDKYFHLISRPNIRSIATISELMKENKMFSETIQADANLEARLASERDFDALGRIQAILQTLEAEKTLGKSNLEAVVQKDLLECVNYYIYRHQRATSELIGHVRGALDALTPEIIESSASEVVARKFRESIEKIKKIELQSSEESKLNYREWLIEMIELQKLIEKQNYEFPELVRRFLNEPKRLERIKLLEEVPRECKELMQNITLFENESGRDLTNDEEYYTSLTKLQSRARLIEFLDDGAWRFVNNPRRLDYISKYRGNNEKSLTNRESMDGEVGDNVAAVTDCRHNAAPVPRSRSEPKHSSPVELVGDAKDLDRSWGHGNELAQMCKSFLDFAATSNNGHTSQTNDNITTNILHTLNEFNTECTASSYQIWIDNNLLLARYREQGFRPFRARITNTLTRICDNQLKFNDTTLSELDCDTVSSVFDLLRRREKARTRRKSLQS